MISSRDPQLNPICKDPLSEWGHAHSFQRLGSEMSFQGPPFNSTLGKETWSCPSPSSFPILKL